MTARKHTRSSSLVTLSAGALLTSTALVTPALADDAQPHPLDRLWSFANVSVNYLDWSNGTEARTASNAAKSDFMFLEIEGGAGFSWGEFTVSLISRTPPTINSMRRAAVKITSVLRAK
jgi:hypothetical protein